MQWERLQTFCGAQFNSQSTGEIFLTEITFPNQFSCKMLSNCISDMLNKILTVYCRIVDKGGSFYFALCFV